jgi:Raf kinase inhibitor-like YbhB/YbcL family protein
MRTVAFLTASLLTGLLLAGCTGTSTYGNGTGTGTSSTGAMAPAQMTIASSAFPPGGTIPEKYSCYANQTAQTSPPLAIAGIPANAVSVALTVIDHDVPTSLIATGTFRHWVVWNVTPQAGQATFPEGGVPPGAVQGKNDAGKNAYQPACPPYPPAHHYNFTAYALDSRPGLSANGTAPELEAWMQGHVLAQATLIGLYEHKIVAT